MSIQQDAALQTANRIARQTERIARWDKEAREIEASWNGAVAYRQFCNAMANAARTQMADLEAEVSQQHGQVTPARHR